MLRVAGCGLAAGVRARHATRDTQHAAPFRQRSPALPTRLPACRPLAVTSLLTHTPEETAALGEAWAREAGPGWTIALCGDLGMGKTQLVQGLARGLGITGRVASPTFALVNEHASGRVPLFHLDLYRLDSREQIVGAGLDEYFFTPRGLTVVEWAERWWGEAVQSAAGRLRWVKITAPSETTRRIEYEDFGA